VLSFVILEPEMGREPEDEEAAAKDMMTIELCKFVLCGSANSNLLIV